MESVNMEIMTIKELANVAGVSIPTLRRTAKKLFPDSIERGVKSVFSKEQSTLIIEYVRKKNMVGPLVQNDSRPVQNEQVNYEAIGKMIGMAVSAALTPVVDRLDRLSNQKALPEPIKEDSYSLVAYCQINQIKVNRSELALHGRSLKKIANRKGIELKKITDERWGFVNSYPVEILKEYFSA